MEQKTKLNAGEGKQDLVITREFDLPLELLFKAYVAPSTNSSPTGRSSGHLKWKIRPLASSWRFITLSRSPVTTAN